MDAIATTDSTESFKDVRSLSHAASFVCNHARVIDCFRNALEKDQADARLSTIFRYYYRVRRFMPIFVRQILQRSRNKSFDLPDDWYIPRDFIRSMSESIGSEPIDMVHPWPGGKQFAVVLSHDVETLQGMKNIDRMAKLEEKHGMRSSWNLVPKLYPIDTGIVKDLQQRGFEIGVHGYNHDGRLFESQREFLKRSNVINDSAGRFSATGFRAPMVHRDLDLILQKLDFDYDASCFDIDPLQAMPGGVGSIWPFIIGDSMVELPYTMPQDHTLFVSLGEEDSRIWQRKLEFLRDNSGMVLMLTHPDYMDTAKRLDLYDRFLGKLNEQGNFWHSLPRGVANWWKYREAIINQQTPSTQTNPEFQIVPARIHAENEEVRIVALTDR